MTAVERGHWVRALAYTLLEIVVAFTIGACIMLAAGCSRPWVRPSAGETVLIAAAVAVTAADVAQTLDVPMRGGQYTEWNPILGRHPSEARILGVGAAAVVGELALWWALPPGWRSVFAGEVLGVEALVVADNFRIGLRWRLP